MKKVSTRPMVLTFNSKNQIRRWVVRLFSSFGFKDEDDTQFEIKDDDDDDIDGEEAGEEMTLHSKASENDPGSKDVETLHPRDVDAFWLQRNVSKHCKV